jgi:UDP-GlcNAc:undecaprenyl-phosphate GlcNAc-1-phosphate transferase
MLIQYIPIVLSGFLLGVFFINVFKKFSLSYNFLNPKGIPLVGGMGMGLSFISVLSLSLLIYQGLSREIIGIIISSTIMLVFGVIDDWRELSIWAKFLVQIISTAFLISFGIRTQIIYIGDILNVIITFIWVLGITNAFNHLDVLDGIAGVTAAIVSLSFLAISLLNHSNVISIFSLAMLGAICSFLIFNLPPAKVYMGNSGSHFLGFTLAAIALLISYANAERKIALLSPLLILGLPIFDTFFLILIRIGNRRLPYKKSNDHLSLRLIKLGYSKVKVLLFMFFLATFFSLCGVSLSHVSNLSGIAIIVAVILISFSLAYWTGKIHIDG